MLGGVSWPSSWGISSSSLSLSQLLQLQGRLKGRWRGLGESERGEGGREGGQGRLPSPWVPGKQWGGGAILLPGCQEDGGGGRDLQREGRRGCRSLESRVLRGGRDGWRGGKGREGGAALNL